MRLVSRVRDALTGRYTTRGQAARSPGTTVTESDGGVTRAARALLLAYDADDSNRASALAPEFEDLRAAIGMQPPGFSTGGKVGRNR